MASGRSVRSCTRWFVRSFSCFKCWISYRKLLDTIVIDTWYKASSIGPVFPPINSPATFSVIFMQRLNEILSLHVRFKYRFRLDCLSVSYRMVSYGINYRFSFDTWHYSYCFSVEYLPGYYPTKKFLSKVCTTFIPVLGTSVSYVWHSYPYPKPLQVMYARATIPGGYNIPYPYPAFV